MRNEGIDVKFGMELKHDVSPLWGRNVIFPSQTGPQSVLALSAGAKHRTQD